MKNIHRFVLAAAFCGMILAEGAAQAATLPLIANGVDWGTNYYNPDVSPDKTTHDGLPNAAGGSSPSWTLVPGGGAAEVVGDHLVISTTGAASHSYRQLTGWDYDPLVGATVEVRMRVEEMTGTAWAASMVFGLGDRYFDLTFSETSIAALSVVRVSQIDLNEWTVLRFTISGPTNAPQLSIYVNNDPTAAFSGQISAPAGIVDYIQFGDGSTSLAQGGSTEWDYIRWSSSGAFQPIPEPHSLALGSLGLLLAGWSVRRRRAVR